MRDLKLKIVTSIVVLATIVASLSLPTTGRACTYMPCDVNRDGLVNMADVEILRLAWGSRIGDINFDPRCDFNEDGIINIKDGALIGIHWTRLLKARVFIFPQTLNLKSRGNWITCIILLPANVKASDVEVSSIRLNNTVAATHVTTLCRFSRGLIVKFSRAEVITLIRENLDSKVSMNCRRSVLVTLTVSGNLTSGLEFSGSDVIRVVHSHQCIH
jgi:hypothetical protein